MSFQKVLLSTIKGLVDFPKVLSVIPKTLRVVHLTSLLAPVASRFTPSVRRTMVSTCEAALLGCETICPTSKVWLQVGGSVGQAAAVVLQCVEMIFPAPNTAAEHGSAALQGCCFILLI
jgi:hypothetical protein